MRMINIIYKRNCVFQTAYHVVWCSKYRKQILIGEVAQYTNDLINTICKENDWRVIAVEFQPDHVHLFVSLSPAIAVATVVKILKGTTARKLFLEFPQLKTQLWGGHLWSPSYYVGTAGNVSAETIKHYIERTEHIAGRR
jgi:putative transposase